MRISSVIWGVIFLATILESSHAATGFAYVVNNGSSSVTVINVSTGAVVKTIAVGSSPYAAVVDQASLFVYVTIGGSNTVSVISTATNAVVANIPVSSGPTELALTPDGKTLYASCGGANVVAVVNTTTRKVTATIPVQNPIGIAVTPNGAFVYVVSSSAGKVLVISTLTRAVVASIAVGTKIPVGVAISPNGSTAYVTNYHGNTVTVIQTANNTITNTINVSPGPYFEGVSPDGHWLYVANYNAGSGNLVTVIDTGTQTIAGTVVVGQGPIGFGFTADSSAVGVANLNSNTLTVIATATRTIEATIAVGKMPTGGTVTGTMHVSTVVGGYTGDGGKATNAALESPSSPVVDSLGNLYIADVTANRIRKVSSTGTISTFAGTGFCGYNGDGIAATAAMLCAPTGIALDPAGNLVVADQGNSRIRSISKTGVIKTIAGTGAFGYSGDGGAATKAVLSEPFQPTYDAAGDLYFSDVFFCVVRKIDTHGTITTVAGNGTCGYSGDNGPAKAAMLNHPRGVALDPGGNLYIADRDNGRVRKVTTAGTISTFAGTGKHGLSGDGGPATSAKIGYPRSLAVRSGSLYISDGGSSRYRVVNLATGVINTYAGTTYGYDGDHHALLASQFSGGTSIGFDAAGNPLFADLQNSRLRKGTAGIVNTIAGGYLGDGGKATSAAMMFPAAAAFDTSGNLYVVDSTGNRVRKVSGGVITTIAGTGVSAYTGDGGLATKATLNEPSGVAVDFAGNVLIADTLNGVVRKVTPAGTISTLAANVNFNSLALMAVDSSNNAYVADYFACVVWKITPTGVVTIAAGVLNTCGYNSDGIAATTAQLNGPAGVAVDPRNGNLIIADYLNNRVRQVASGTISTVAGDGTCGYSGDGGSATSAQLCPNAVAVDNGGNIYAADNGARIRKIREGTITTFAGAGFGFNGNGLWPLYTNFGDVLAVAIDATGAVYEVDDWDHIVRKIQ